MSYNISIAVKNLEIHNFSKRLEKYNNIQKYLKTLNNHNCLKTIDINEKGEFIYELENGTLILKNRIGTKSKYGVIYLTKNKFNNLLLATKLTVSNNDNYTEIKIAKQLSKITIRNINPHFLITYKSFYCINNKINKNLPLIIRKDDYYISINELVNGNLKQFFKLNLSYSYILNALQQILLAILSFHYFTNGIYHRDCHYGNFLFIKIKSGGYFHYKIFGKDYYIKNMGYLWLIWDFGLAKNEPNKRLKDYFRILYFFTLSSKLSLSSYTNFNKISDIVENILIYEDKYDMFFGNLDKKFFEDCIFKQPDLFLTINDIPKTFKKINKKPYIINEI